jgi:hypothetical protein
MAFQVPTPFAPGSDGGAISLASPPDGPGGGSGGSPFFVGSGLSEAPSNQAGGGSPFFPISSPFQPVKSSPEGQGSGHSPFSAAPAMPPQGGMPFSPQQKSPFSAEGSGGGLTVGDLLPSLPPDVARGHGLPHDQPVSLSQQVIDQAVANGSFAVPLFEVYRVCPVMFQVPVSPTDPRSVSLPPSFRGAGRSQASAPPALQHAMASPAPSPFNMMPESASPMPGAAPGFAMPAPQMGVGAPAGASPFGIMPGATPEPHAPSSFSPASQSKPIGALPPRRPDGVPPAIPTQNDFAAPSSLQLPKADWQGAPQASFAPPERPAPAPAAGASPFSFSPPAQEAAARPPMPEAAAPMAPPQAPPSMGGFFQPSASFAPAAFTPPTPAAPASRPLMPSFLAPAEPAPPAAPPVRPVQPASSFQMPAAERATSRPLTPPVPGAPSGDTVDLPLASILKGYSPQELGFDPSFIPAWIVSKLPSHVVNQASGTGAKIDLGTIMDGTEESFRPVIAHGKRDFRIALPANDVFHSLPQTNAVFGASSPEVRPLSRPLVQSPMPMNGMTGAPGSQPPSPASPPLQSSPTRGLLAGGHGQPAPWQSPGFPGTIPLSQGPAPIPQSPAPPVALAPQAPFAPEPSPFGSLLPSFPSPAQPPVQANPVFSAPASRPLMAPSQHTGANVTLQPISQDQMLLRALLGAAGPFDKQSALQSLCRQPGVDACFAASDASVLSAGSGTATAAEFQAMAADLARGVRALAKVMNRPAAEPFCLSAGDAHVSFASHGSLLLGVLHQPGEPPSGLREKLVPLAKELASI